MLNFLYPSQVVGCRLATPCETHDKMSIQVVCMQLLHLHLTSHSHTHRSMIHRDKPGLILFPQIDHREAELFLLDIHLNFHYVHSYMITVLYHNVSIQHHIIILTTHQFCNTLHISSMHSHHDS